MKVICQWYVTKFLGDLVIVYIVTFTFFFDLTKKKIEIIMYVIWHYCTFLYPLFYWWYWCRISGWLTNCYHIKTWVWKSIWLTWRKLSHLLTFDMLNRVFQIAVRSGGLKILLGEIFLPAGGNLRRSDFGQSDLSQS